MIDYIEASAEACGIQSVILDSDANIETQLNNLTKVEDLPIMLISWDIDVNLTFTSDGFLDTPEIPIVGLLMTKSKTKEKKDMQADADRMGYLFAQFIQHLYGVLSPLQKNSQQPAIKGATYKRLPKYGMGWHSGVMCKFTMKIPIEIEC